MPLLPTTTNRRPRNEKTKKGFSTESVVIIMFISLSFFSAASCAVVGDDVEFKDDDRPDDDRK